MSKFDKIFSHTLSRIAVYLLVGIATGFALYRAPLLVTIEVAIALGVLVESTIAWIVRRRRSTNPR